MQLEIIKTNPNNQCMNDSISSQTSNAILQDTPSAEFAIGQVVKHRLFDFRGVIYDVDPIYSNDDAWYESIPKDLRPKKEQPFYHLFAENNERNYIAYVSQQNLVLDGLAGPINHPQIKNIFGEWMDGHYKLQDKLKN